MLRTGYLLLTLLITSANVFAQTSVSDGIAAYNRGDYATAAKLLVSHAQQGDRQAQVYVGLMYFNGVGLPEDDQKSFASFTRAAKQGYAEGQYQLGFMYAFDYGVPGNETAPMEQAAKWFRAAADQGHADAQYNLGLLYLAGSGVAMDETEGLRWVRRAADSVSEGARRFIGEID